MVRVVGLEEDVSEELEANINLAGIATKLFASVDILEPRPRNFLLRLPNISESIIIVNGPPISLISVRDPVLLPYVLDLARNYEKEDYGSFTIQKEYRE